MYICTYNIIYINTNVHANFLYIMINKSLLALHEYRQQISISV